MREPATSAILSQGFRIAIAAAFFGTVASALVGWGGASAANWGAENGAVDAAPETVAPEDSELETVRLATLRWPPYTSDVLPEEGAATSVVRAAFATQHHDVEVQFWPWNRAIAKARDGDERIIAYFPGYHCRHDPRGDFIRSDAVGATPLGFAEHTQAPQNWKTLEDLTDKRVGTVLGYAHTEEFDQRIDEGIQRVITSSNDIANLLKLADRQIHFAAIDRFVMAYVLSTEEALQPHRDALRFHDRPLGQTALYLCFRNDATGQELRRIFNAGLQEIDAEALLLDYVNRLVKP